MIANGSDPALNRRLANALERARTSDVPKKVVDHAIQKVLSSTKDDDDHHHYHHSDRHKVPDPPA